MKRTAALCFALAVGLVACGGTDAEVNTTSGGSNFEQSPEDGAGNGNGGSGAIPDDFPIPAPQGANLEVTTELEGNTALTLTMPANGLDDAIAFYDSWTTAELDEYQRIESESGSVSWLRTSGPDGSARIILVSAPVAGDDVVIITLTDASD